VNSGVQELGGRELAAKLAAILAVPETLVRMPAAECDLLMRAARNAKLLGTLAHRLSEARVESALPQVLREQCASELALSRHRRQMVLWEIDRLSRALSDVDTPVVLLKGAAYIVQTLPAAAGRMPSDVDILVRRDRIAEVERTLLRKGWQTTPMNAYDQRYYRQWSHEIPPLRYGPCPLELDVHHAIVPPGGRARPAASELIGSALTVPGSPFPVLSPEDQTLHATLQLFYDSDCSNRLRDLLDIDGLLRTFSARPGYWERLTQRAGAFGAAHSLACGLRHTARVFGTPIPDSVAAAVSARGRGWLPQSAFDALVESAMAPAHPDGGAARTAVAAAGLLRARALCLRFPPSVVIRHVAARTLHAVLKPVRPDTEVA